MVVPVKKEMALPPFADLKSQFSLFCFLLTLFFFLVCLRAVPIFASERALDLSAMLNGSGSPLIFEENTGQYNEKAKFLIRGGGSTLWISEDALWITTLEKGKENKQLFSAFEDRQATPRNLNGVNLKISFPNSNSSMRVEPMGRLDTKISYFSGNDPEQWKSDVPVWSGVRFVDIYPGVDLEITGYAGGLTPWFVVKDHLLAESQNFRTNTRLRVEGADHLSLENGMVKIETGSGDVLLPLFGLSEEPLSSPTAYSSGTSYSLASSGAETFFTHVEGNEVVSPFLQEEGVSTSEFSGENVVKLQTAGTSDSSMVYGTFLGGSAYDYGYSIAVDSSGNAYVAGIAASSDFPVTPGAFQADGFFSSFVAKLNALGTGLVYATFLGNVVYEDFVGIAVDSSGNAYITGMTNLSGFPVTPDALQPVHGGDFDAFVSKLDASGTSLLYSTFLGGSSRDHGYGIVVDGLGNICLTGETSSANFPVTAGALQTSHGGGQDVFVAKLNPAGSSLVYSTYLGGRNHEYSGGIAADESGNVYVTGGAREEFPVTPGGFQVTPGGNQDAFAAKLNPLGTKLLYSTFLGGSGLDDGNGIAVDGSGNAYVTGDTESLDFPTTSGALQTLLGNGLSTFLSDAFITKLNPSGTELVYSTYIGGQYHENSGGIALDSSGNAFVTGRTYSTDFPVTPGALQPIPSDPYDVFVAKLDGSGESLLYGTYLGGFGFSDYGRGIAVDSSGNAYVTGNTDSTNFPVTPGALQPFISVYTDAFVVKLTQLEVSKGSVSVTITGPTDARWSLDGKGSYSSGYVLNEVAVGTHTISFSDVAGWEKPADIEITVTKDITSSLTTTYVQSKGSVSVTITGPSQAHWSLDGTGSYTSGQTISDVIPGSHTVSFSGIPGWTTPADINLSLDPGESLSLTGQYTLSAAMPEGWKAIEAGGSVWLEWDPVQGFDGPVTYIVNILDENGNVVGTYNVTLPFITLNLEAYTSYSVRIDVAYGGSIYTGQNWNFTPVSSSRGAWILAENTNIYKYRKTDSGDEWTWTPARAKYVTAVTEDTCWISEASSDTLYQFSGGTWTWTPAKSKWVSAYTRDDLWLVEANTDTLYNYKDGVWIWTPAKAKVISAPNDRVLWLVEKSSGYVYKHTPGTGTWEWTPGTALSLSAATEDVVWVISLEGNWLYRYDHRTGEWRWHYVKAKAVSAVSESEAWFVDMDGRLCVLKDEAVTMIGGACADVSTYPSPAIISTAEAEALSHR